MIYWFLQLATSDALAQGVDVKTQSVHCLGGERAHPAAAPQVPKRSARVWTPRRPTDE